MKLIFSSNSSWSIYNFRTALLLALSAQGFDIYIVAPKGKYLDKLNDLGFQTVPIVIDNSSQNILANIKLMFDLFRLYRTLNPDIVLHNAIKPNIYGALVCRLLGIPVINNISGLGSIFMSHGVSSFFGKLLYRFSQQKAKKVFFQNSADLSFFKSNNLIKPEQCSLLPGSGVDLERFKPMLTKRDDALIKFCFVGRLIGDKGIYEFIAAAKKMKSVYSNVEFYILGELYLKNPTSISKEKLDEWIAEKTIIYLGKSDSVEKELSKFDCIVLPSYREGMARVLLEASSMAIPIITSDVPGCADVVENNKNGFICKVKNSEDLFLQMEKFISLSYDKRLKMGVYGREKVVKEFDEKIVIEKYIEAIDQIIQPDGSKF